MSSKPSSKNTRTKQPQPRRAVAVRRLPAPVIEIDDDHDDTPPTTTDHREIEDNSDNQAEQFLSSIGAGTGGIVTAYRIVGGIKRYLPERFEAAGFDLAKVYAVYGGGDFLLEFRIGGQIRSKARVYIEGQPKTPQQEQPPATMQAAPTDALTLIVQRLERIEQRAQAPERPAVDPLDQMQKLLAISAAMNAPIVEIMKSQRAPQPSTPAAELAQVLELARSMNNGARAEDDEEAATGLKGLASAAATFAAEFFATQRQKAQPAQATEQPQARPALPAAPEAGAEEPHPLAGTFTDEQIDRLERVLDTIEQAATSDTPHQQAADIAKWQLGTDAATVATIPAEAVIEIVYRARPELEKHGAYVRAVAALLTSQEKKQ